MALQWGARKRNERKGKLEGCDEKGAGGFLDFKAFKFQSSLKILESESLGYDAFLLGMISFLINGNVSFTYYSMYGHIERLARKVEEGANLVEGVEAILWQACVYVSLNAVPETLTTEELAKLGAPPKSDVPIIHPNELSEADGFIFGFPTRFGMMAAQFKAFLDATEDLRKTQQLAGKPAAIITSTSSQGGGQETTVLTGMTPLVHHGMIFVPFGMGFTYGHEFGYLKEVKGGSPYGAGIYAGREGPTWLEWMHAFQQGYFFANITKQLKEATA
ncbi:NAD(P)H dehydrogenase (quinone) FQR 1 [Spatholobus suberectus]|nr:NAD(P)H dehydrogenase (quinone) FQR 1 [Spatholobus suberectus]